VGYHFFETQHMCLCVLVMSQLASRSLKSPSSDAATYDARHCVLCWVYGDGDDDVSSLSMNSNWIAQVHWEW